MYRASAIVLAVTTLVLTSTPVTATSLLNVGPLAKADEVSVEVPVVGNTLAPNADDATPLFGTDWARSDRFKAALASTVSARLKAGGLAVTGNAGYAVSLSLFGGTFPRAGCPNRAFYSLEVWVGAPGEPHADRERVVLGVADDKDLESSILAAASAVIDEFTAQRSRYRDARK